MLELIENAVNLPWGRIMGTLMIRFIGVFMVLIILMISMMILGKVVSKLIEMQEARKAEDDEKEAPAIALAEEPELEAGEEEVVAAIGAAIAMAMDLEQKFAAPSAFAGLSAGSWALTGRAAQMNTRLQGGEHKRS